MRNLSLKVKVIIIAAAAVVLTGIILLIVLLNGSRKIGKALDIKKYDNVNIVISQSMTQIEDENTSSEQESSQAEQDFSDESAYGEGYDLQEYNNYSSEYTESQGTQSTTDESEVCTLKKDGDVIYVKGLSGEVYYYSRDDKDYALYYYDFYGLEDGKWIEVAAENYSVKPEFDFSVLNDIKNSKLKKTGDCYVPENNTQELFYSVLQTVNKDKYTDCSIKFYFDKDNLVKIAADYTYDGKFTVKQVYDISYKAEKITVPKADETK